MRLFIDTNVVVDFLGKRKPFLMMPQFSLKWGNWER